MRCDDDNDDDDDDDDDDDGVMLSAFLAIERLIRLIIAVIANRMITIKGTFV